MARGKLKSTSVTNEKTFLSLKGIEEEQFKRLQEENHLKPIVINNENYYSSEHYYQYKRLTLSDRRFKRFMHRQRVRYIFTRIQNACNIIGTLSICMLATLLIDWYITLVLNHNHVTDISILEYMDAINIIQLGAFDYIWFILKILLICFIILFLTRNIVTKKQNEIEPSKHIFKRYNIKNL